MSNDFRSKNRRKSQTITKKRTRTIDGGTGSYRVYGDNNPGSSSAGVGDNQRAFRPRQDVSGYSYGSNGQFAVANERGYKSGTEFTLYNGQKGTYHDGAPGSIGGYLEVTYDKADKRVTDSYQQKKLSAKDRLGKSETGKENEKVNRKRKGRSALLIQPGSGTDKSGSRLKPQAKKKDKRVGVQGGSDTGNGLNIPR